MRHAVLAHTTISTVPSLCITHTHHTPWTRLARFCSELVRLRFEWLFTRLNYFMFVPGGTCSVPIPDGVVHPRYHRLEPFLKCPSVTTVVVNSSSSVGKELDIGRAGTRIQWQLHVHSKDIALHLFRKPFKDAVVNIKLEVIMEKEAPETWSGNLLHSFPSARIGFGRCLKFVLRLDSPQLKDSMCVR